MCDCVYLLCDSTTQHGACCVHGRLAVVVVVVCVCVCRGLSKYPRRMRHTRPGTHTCFGPTAMRETEMAMTAVRRAANCRLNTPGNSQLQYAGHINNEHTPDTSNLKDNEGRPSAAPNRGFVFLQITCVLCLIGPRPLAFPVAYTMCRCRGGCTWSQGRCRSCCTSKRTRPIYDPRGCCLNRPRPGLRVYHLNRRRSGLRGPWVLI